VTALAAPRLGAWGAPVEDDVVQPARFGQLRELVEERGAVGWGR
jgi:hypothetical protein